MAKRPETILHVDDDDANRYAVSRSLMKAGYVVCEAANGKDALLKAADKPDLIILDVRLPDIPGFEVCRRIKSDPATASIPVLHLSASFISGTDKAHGLDGGADAYLVRPVEPVELIATIKALLRAKRSEEALRQSEERFRLLVQDICDYAIFMIDSDGRIGSWNAGATKVLGFDAEEVIGLSAGILFTEEDQIANVLQQEMHVATATGRAPAKRWQVRKSGDKFFVDGVLTALHDDMGKLVGFSKLMRDVTEQMRSEEERQRLLRAAKEAQSAAETANRIKDDFLATLSHELRTPLNAIIGWANILRIGPTTPEDYADGLETIERNANIQAQLIGDLLDVSRIISGKLRLEMKLVDLRRVIESAVATVQPVADAKKVKIERLFNEPSHEIYGDSHRLQQVVWNLLSNAIKFTPTGGKVQLQVIYDQATVRIIVSDTGKGISAEFLPFVFDRFRQADPSTTRSHGGLGLGLAIVKQLVGLHNGSVSVTSDGEGCGSSFVVTLQLTTNAQAGGYISTPRSSLIELGSNVILLNGISVLVVEDDADSRVLIKRILSAAKADVTVAMSVSEAMSAVESRRFDVLVSDIGMPEEDGYDLLRKIRALPEVSGGKIPAVALTAFAQAADRQRMLNAGFQVHLPKPVDPAELVATVARVAGRSEKT